MRPIWKQEIGDRFVVPSSVLANANPDLSPVRREFGEVENFERYELGSS